MYWLIEKDDQLEVLLNSGYTKAYIEVIPSSHNIHPVENSVSLVYIKPINAPKGYMLCLSHSETLSVSKTGIDRLLEKFEVLYCRDKKETLHYLPLKALVDINIPPHTYIQELTKAHEILYYKHRDKPNVNEIVPVVKHYEMCENTFWELKTNINKDKTKYDEFFNSRVSVVFNALERSGLRIHVPRFEQHFHPVNGERVYSQYNLKTLTTRPSNKFKGVNYAALNKENGCRKSFIPSNDILCEIDISAYHPSLSCRLVDYSFPTVDIHDHMAKLYKVSYAKSKELTFKQLYGGVFDNYRHLEFFQKIEEYVGKTWDKFQSDGKIECPISGFVFSKDRLENMNPQKLFNYLLQNLETSMNVRILWDVLQLIRGKKTKLILYTYDSFLFDFSQDEQDVMENIQDVFNKYKLNIKIKQGYDYDFR
tara:strand:- start:1503 stop:2771 length:1269 start_codon:yes stop_codon:yes gene_type:complete